MLDWRHLEIGECTSVMDAARELLKSGGPLCHPMTLRCAHQTAGRGQMKRSWHSRPNCNLLMVQMLESRLFKAPEMASLGAGIALAETLKDFGLKALLRWPNDLLADGRKIAGILVENCREWILVGTGLNILDPERPDSLLDGCRRTSILACLGRALEQEEIVKGYCRHLEKNLGLSKSQMPAAFRKLALFGERIFLGGKRLPATTLDIGEAGELIVKQDDGTIRSVSSSGEIAR